MKIGFSGIFAACFVLLFDCARAQKMIIDFPVERTVFQRGLDNMGTVYLSASIDRKADSICIRLQEYKNNELSGYIDWRKISNTSSGGYFLDEIRVKGGWYKLEVRVYLQGEVYTEGTVNKVGVGEVFLISGQSNAQGVPGFNGKLGLGAKDDRVNCADFTNTAYQTGPFFPLIFNQLGDNSNIGPMGLTPWVWGEVGDSLVKRLGVPVMFFNSALTGTLSYNWWQSSRGEPTFSAIFQNNFVLGFPYQNLKIGLQQYASLLGIRAVLWHQGETDTFPGIPREDEIYGYYKEFIQASRGDYGKNVAWMVSRASYSAGILSNQVIAAQNRVISEPGLNVFQGPFTDNLQIPRPDGVHFQNTADQRGLGLLASAWLDYLSDSFFASCVPILENPLVKLELSCGEGPVSRLTIPQAYTLEKWNDDVAGNTRLVSTGIYRAIVKDRNFNYKISNRLNIQAVVFDQPDAPVAAKNYLCEDEELLLEADKRFESVVWSDNSSGFKLTAKTSGEYGYTATNGAGCEFRSPGFMLEQVKSPVDLDSFGVEANGVKTEGTVAFSYCENEELRLSATEGFYGYEWSDGVKSNTRTGNGIQALSVKASYGPGCQTLEAQITLTERAAPIAPKISQTGLYELSAIPENENSELVWFRQAQFFAVSKNPVRIRESGEYFAVYQSTYDGGLVCSSAFSERLNVVVSLENKVVVYPNPTEETLYLESPDRHTNFQGFITDALGRQVLEIKNLQVWDEKMELTLKGLAPGNYLLYLQSDQLTYRQRIFVR